MSCQQGGNRMMARGDQVRLPHGKGVGLVLDSANGLVLVYIGDKHAPGGEPIVEEFVECEVMWTGKHFGAPARAVIQRLNASRVR